MTLVSVSVKIVKMQWPTAYINNIALYRLCKVKPLSERVEQSRWRMLGHILRCDDLNPAQLALHFAIESNKLYKGRIGRHQTNLIRVIMNDVKCRHLKLNDIQDLVLVYKTPATAV